MSRRRALLAGGGAVGGLMLAPGAAMLRPAVARAAGSLPVKRIEEIIQIPGAVSNGVLDISVGRDDIGEVKGPEGATFDADFEIHGDLYFQPLGRGRAIMNGDLALKPEEVNPFIDALLANGITWQAFHQHLFGLTPMVWFTHFRAVGDPLAIARGIHAAIKNATSTPLPQAPPPHPTTPLNPGRLAHILHGSATVGGGGVVTVSVPRTDRIVLAGVQLEPDTGISTTIEFKPLGGSRAWAVPDFSMRSSEVVPVARTMRSQGWLIGCLYNQETAEQPQLYFSHQLKKGNAYALAREIRRGLDHTHSA